VPDDNDGDADRSNNNDDSSDDDNIIIVEECTSIWNTDIS
jgi:hypothetical protein